MTMKIKMVPVSLLFADQRYQRGESKSRVNKMAANFDPSLLQILEVSEREDGRYALVDGQHRAAMVRKVKGDNYKVQVRIHTGLSLSEEASLFARFQKERRNLSKLDEYKADLVAGVPDAIALERVSARHGLKIGMGKNEYGYVQAVAVCREVILTHGEENLDKTFLVILQAWKRQPRSFRRETISGVSGLIASYSKIDLDRVVTKLQGLLPDALVTTASVRVNGATGRVREVAFMNLLIEEYNKGLRKAENKLSRVD